MKAPVWATDLARAFWSQADATEPFPRSLRRAIARALPLTIVLLPKLCISASLEWLQRVGVTCSLDGENRPLRACLVARHGQGFAFIDGTDADDEQRFSLAHELAHFLRDYQHPRHRALQRIGPAALEVLDGQRPPTHEERLSGLLDAVPLGFHVHLLDRTPHGEPARGDIADAESAADRLAYELLAPAEHLASVHRNILCEGANMWAEVLCNDYGFPNAAAHRYAQLLQAPTPAVDSLLRAFRASMSMQTTGETRRGE